MLQPRSLTAGTLSIWINLTGFLACSLLSWKKLKKCNDSGSTGSTSEQGTSFAAEGDMQSRQCTRLQVSLQFVLLGAERDPISLCSTHCELSKKHNLQKILQNVTALWFEWGIILMTGIASSMFSTFSSSAPRQEILVPQVLCISVHIFTPEWKVGKVASPPLLRGQAT